jgi:hypothetical protein
MPRYNHKDLDVYIADGLSPRLSISALLSNVASFHVRLLDVGQIGCLFAVSSPEYSIDLQIQGGSVRFARNTFVVSKAIGPFTHSCQILLSWKPNVLQLALIVDNEDKGCCSVETPLLLVPKSVLTHAREFSLLPRTSYPSPHEFAAHFIDGLSQLRERVKGARRSFWDYPRLDRSRGSAVPKPEPQSMALIAAFLDDHATVGGYELDRETLTAVGSLDLKAVTAISGGGLAKIANRR